MPAKPLTAAEFTALLDILQDPNNPNFTQALDRLTTFNPAGLSGPETAALLTRLQTTIANLSTESTLTAGELTKLRTSGKALQSYGNVK
jgi:hypothetical protein